MSVTVHKYGVHYKWLQEHQPILEEQLRATNDLWNRLVEIQQAFEAQKQAIWSSYPAVASAENRASAAGERVTTLSEQMTQARKEQRTKTIRGPLTDQLKQSKAELKSARQDRRDAIAAVREDAKTRLRDAVEAKAEATKSLYQVFVVDGPLYWAAFNDVVRRRFQVAVKRMEADRAAGRPATLRFSRYDGTGTIAVQLQRAAGQPARTPSAVADGVSGKWRNVLHIPYASPLMWEASTRAGQRRQGRVMVRMRAGQAATGEAQWLHLPVQVHRIFPHDADITEARLTVRRYGPDLRAHLTVVAKVEAAAPVADGPDVAFHLGWMAEDDGSIRVGTWRATQPLDVPHDLRHVIKADSGGLTGTVVMPARVADRHEAIHRIQSQRADALNRVRASLIAWVTEHGPLPDPWAGKDIIDPGDSGPVTVKRLSAWRSPGRFVALSRHLSDQDDWAASAPAFDLAAWAAQDRKDWAHQGHGRAKVLAHRDDLWRNVAKVISDQAGRLIVDDTNVARLARVEEDTNVPAAVAEAAARRRVIAAPGGLRAAVVAACVRDGVEVVEVSAADLSRTHPGCGHVQREMRGRPVACEGCGRAYDPDAAATLTMIARANKPSAKG